MNVPAKMRREKVIENLKKFEFENVEATVPSDKDLVKGMIVTMMRNENTNLKEEGECIKAFEAEVRGEVRYRAR